MQGILLIAKRQGWTSFDVVNYVRKLVAQMSGKKPKQVKVGHIGTLDPLATGLVVVLVGKAFTRRAGEFTKLDKTYEAELQLGMTSTTGDEEGEKQVISDYQPSEEELQAAIKRYVGVIEQVPPIFSAVKVDGQRAYALARAGKAVALHPRQITIYTSTLLSYRYPFVTLHCEVSSGTYIRSLATDIGSALGTGAYLTALCRMRIGSFDLDQAVDVTALTPQNLEHLLQPFGS